MVGILTGTEAMAVWSIGRTTPRTNAGVLPRVDGPVGHLADAQGSSGFLRGGGFATDPEGGGRCVPSGGPGGAGTIPACAGSTSTNREPTGGG